MDCPNAKGEGAKDGTAGADWPKINGVDDGAEVVVAVVAVEDCPNEVRGAAAPVVAPNGAGVDTGIV